MDEDIPLNDLPYSQQILRNINMKSSDTWSVTWSDMNTLLWVHFMQGTHQNLQTARLVTEVLPVTLATGVSGGCCSTFQSDDL